MCMKTTGEANCALIAISGAVFHFRQAEFPPVCCSRFIKYCLTNNTKVLNWDAVPQPLEDTSFHFQLSPLPDKFAIGGYKEPGTSAAGQAGERWAEESFHSVVLFCTKTCWEELMNSSVMELVKYQSYLPWHSQQKKRLEQRGWKKQFRGSRSSFALGRIFSFASDLWHYV